MRIKFQYNQVRMKYFYLMLGISILPLLLLGYISFNIAKNTLIENQLKTTENNLKTSSEVADLLFRNIINMERLISWSPDVRRELIDSAKYAGVGQNIMDNETTKRIQNLISSYLIDTQYIDSVCLFDVNYRAVCYGNSNSIGKYANGGIYRTISYSTWYKKSAKKQGRPVFFENNVLNNEQSKDTFSSVKLLKDSQDIYNNDKIGLLVVNINKSMFTRVFQESNQNEWAIIDFSKKKENAFMENPSTLNLKLNRENTLESSLKLFQEKGYLTSSYQNQTTGWTFVQLTKEKELLKESNQIGLATALISALLGLIVLFLSFSFSGKVSRPLINLRNIFQKVTVENKELNEKLVQAQLKEREAELRTLQAQIKPHFLYNTLDSIYWMAIMQNNHDIAKIAVALSESFKLSLNKGEDMIPVSMELEHIRHYMTIQNLRFQDRFKYIENVDPDLMDKKILKLMLQPLVENAIYHGLEPKVGDGIIELTGKVKDGWVIFTVSDNGVGIKDIKATEQGYGLRNVRERLLLCYGADSILTISSRVNEGTSIEIKFLINAREE
ncbi:sensor histidine kinase [Bacillus sp. AFS076308]|uniref:sensor histidine kinase n=1 Tax=Bacillus sp. AFS076308 TaxID=2033512 RepID=UPI000BF59E69|nr:sensor histidine kinase [Bacillus sp. AFS076308]PFO06362.1 sensor histidine kinase [Bacillus sp. AFS076308]